MKTIVNINVCVEIDAPENMVNDAKTIEKQIIDTLGLVDSPVCSFDIDVDIFETGD